MLQLTATVPLKPVDVLSVIKLVLPVVAPEVKLRLWLAGLSVKLGATKVTGTLVVTEYGTEPPEGVPVEVSSSVALPLLPVGTLTVTLVLPVPPEVSATEFGVTEQVGVPPATLLPEIEHVVVTVPTKPLTEVSCRLVVLPLRGADVTTVSGDGVAAAVKLEPVTVTSTAGDVITTPPLVPVTVTLRVPVVPTGVTILRVLTLEPPEVTETLLGCRLQVPDVLPVTAVTVQERFTVPVKPPTEAIVIPSVFPVVAPEMKVSDVDTGVML